MAIPTWRYTKVSRPAAEPERSSAMAAQLTLFSVVTGALAGSASEPTAARTRLSTTGSPVLPTGETTSDTATTTARNGPLRERRRTAVRIIRCAVAGSSVCPVSSNCPSRPAA